MAEYAMKKKREGNKTGIPTQLKTRVEKSTGLSLGDMRVHYNSELPAKLDALAYTQENQVEIGSGQERYQPYELGHVVQRFDNGLLPVQPPGQSNRARFNNRPVRQPGAAQLPNAAQPAPPPPLPAGQAPAPRRHRRRPSIQPQPEA